MPKLTFKFETSVTPQQFIDALTDFGPNRNQMWVNSTSHYLEVHAMNDTFADVTEGSEAFGGIWERLHYDWSDPHNVILKTVDSNIWNSKSSWVYTITPALDGMPTTIEYTVERFPRNNKGRFVLAFVSLYRKRILRKDFSRLLRTIET